MQGLDTYITGIRPARAGHRASHDREVTLPAVWPLVELLTFAELPVAWRAARAESIGPHDRRDLRLEAIRRKVWRALERQRRSHGT